MSHPNPTHEKSNEYPSDHFRSALKKAKGEKKMIRVKVNKTPEQIGHTITDHRGRVLQNYTPKK